MAISLAWHHGAAFPAEAAIIPLQTMQPCSTCPAGLHTLPAPGQSLSQAVTTAGSWQSLPKGGTGLLGCTTFPHVHYHTCFYSFHNSRLPFIFLTVLLPFFFNFQGIVGFFSFFPVYLFLLHSVSWFSFPLSPTTTSALETGHFHSSFFLFICGQLLFLTQQFL